MSMQDDVLPVALFRDPEGTPAPKSCALVLPYILSMLWSCNIAVEFDPPDHIYAWVVSPDGASHVFLVRVTFKTMMECVENLEYDVESPGHDLAYGVGVVLWSLLHREVTTDEHEQFTDEQSLIRDEAFQRVRDTFDALVERMKVGEQS